MSGTQGQTSFILVTDIYRSSALWERYPDEFSRALEEHNGIVEQAVESRGGEIMKNLGDGYIALFDEAAACVSAMVDVERGMDAVPALPDETPLQVRLVGHGGPLKRLAVGKGYFGHALNRCSRICQVCHPGQALVTQAVQANTGEAVDGVKLTDLGSHHLRDLAEPERLYQLDHPEFRIHKFPPLPTLEYRPNNLVYQPNEFIGRDAEMAELKALLLGKNQRLITITAPGGYGKSRLATQLCANLLDQYENGVFEVLLAPVGSHERIVGATADALGFQFYGKAEPREQLIDYLREKQMLVLFDNFEHVMAGKDLLADILQHAPKVSLLVTSREPLRLKAEKVYKLEPLPVGASRETRDAAPSETGVGTSRPTGVGTSQEGWQASVPTPPNLANEFASPVIREEELPEAVQLFLDRATLVKHDFALTAENFALVGEICSKLEGVPLAIELAAAWTDSFTLAELLSEVEQQLELTAKLSDVPERQRSIRASLDWSYNLLTDEQREVLRAVSTFKGGFFFEAAEAIVGRGRTVAIAALARRRLRAAPEGDGGPNKAGRPSGLSLRVEDSDPALQVPLRKTLAQLCDKGWLFTREALGKTRFYIRDAAMHQYAFEKLNELDEFETTVLGHSQYFAKLTEREGERLKGHGQIEALKILGVELENIYEGLSAALTSENAEILIPFAKHLVSHLAIVSKWQEGLPWYEKVWEVAEAVRNEEVLTQALLGCGKLNHRLGKYETAEEYLHSAKELAEKSGDRKSTANALDALGLVAYYQGRYEKAESFHQESLKIEEEIGNRHGIATSCNNLGNVAFTQGQYEEAEKLYSESLKVKREIGDRSGIAISYNNLGNVAYSQRRYDKAEKLHYESLEIEREIGNRDGIAASLDNLGLVAKHQGRYDKAEKLHKESLEIEVEIGDCWGIAASLNNLGIATYFQGRYDEAEMLHKESLKIREEIGDNPGIILSLNNLGNVAHMQQDIEEAEKLYQESLQISRETGNRHGIAESLCNLGALRTKQERYSNAIKYTQEALIVSGEIGAQDENISGLITCGYFLTMTAKFKESAVLLFGTRHQTKEMGYKIGLVEQGEMDDGMAKIKDVLSEDELAEARASAEKMSLDELTDFALKALEELEL